MRDRELTAGDIAARLGMSASAISQHLAKLRETGVLIERRSGRLRLYRIDQVRLDEIASALGSMWSADEGRLAALAEAATRGEVRGEVAGDGPQAERIVVVERSIAAPPATVFAFFMSMDA